MKQSIWKRLSRTTLLTHPRLTVYEDEVLLPDGHKTHYIHFSGTAGSATIIAQNSQGKILLQREYSYPPNEWLYQFPGGKVEDGEDPSLAIVRELAEEAGMGGEVTQIGWFYTDNRRKSDKFYVFVATNLVLANGTKDPEEDIEDYWVTEAEIDEMVRNGTLVNYSALAAWALYKAHKD